MPKLSEDHWKVAKMIRDYYLKFGIAPMARKLFEDTGKDLKTIHALFPSGPAKGACKIAGLPKPTGRPRSTSSGAATAASVRPIVRAGPSTRFYPFRRRRMSDIVRVDVGERRAALVSGPWRRMDVATGASGRTAAAYRATQDVVAVTSGAF